jgi:hypothetical protein
MQELRWIYDRRDLEEARRDLTSWLQKWQPKYPKLCNWVEDNIEQTLSFYKLPLYWWAGRLSFEKAADPDADSFPREEGNTTTRLIASGLFGPA